MNKALLIVGIVAIAALLMYFTKQPSLQIPVLENETENVTETKGITYGDLVAINFVLYLENGTVADTNDVAVAEKNKLLNYHKGPFVFILGQSGKVTGFDEALLGMEEGEHRETMIEPSEKEVKLTVGKTKALRRFVTINKIQAFPVASYNTFFKKQPVVGDIVKSEAFAFKYKVVNMTNKSIITEIYAKEGEEYVLPNTEWKSAVVKVAEEDIMFYQMPEENQTLETPFGRATINFTKSIMFINFQPELNKVFNKSIEMGRGFSIPQSFQVVEVHENEFVIQRYGTLTDKRLKLVADLLSITKGVKEVKQTHPLITEVVGGTEQ